MDEVLNDLQQQLLLLENSYPVSTQTELARVRCPFCGDSDNLKSAHFYIGVKNINGKDVPVYDCKKCGQSGIFSYKVMNKLGIYNIEFEIYLKKISRSVLATKNFSSFDELSARKYQYIFPKTSEKDIWKLRYLYERLGIDFSNHENICKYKIIINLNDFIYANRLADVPINAFKREILSECGIGFLSEDKKSISIRNCMRDKYPDFNFNIVRLYKNEQNKRPFTYIPPCAVNILSDEPRIVVCESCFDIINIKNYFYPDSTNAIFSSANRRNYITCIIRLMSITGFVNGVIDIYADNDKNLNIRELQLTLSKFMSTFSINVFINNESKDFGVIPKEGDKFKVTKIIL